MSNPPQKDLSDPNDKYNFPLFKTIEVDDEVVVFLEKTLELYKSENSGSRVPQFQTSKDSYRCGNFLLWDNSEFNKFKDTVLIDLYSKHLNISSNKIDIMWSHALDYGSGALMSPHKHMHNEDFGMLIYLNDCDDGQTQFYLNDHNDGSRIRTKYRLTPRKGFGVCFSSMVLHEGLFSIEGKRMFVSGVRINV
jgi:hypothetical protein